MACVHTLVREVKGLISLPEIGIKVSTMLRNEDVSMTAVAAVIEQDPAISAAVLRMANSALLSRGKEVVSISRALLRLGTNQSAELAIGISVAHAFDGISADKMTVKQFWRHSINCAAASRLIASKILLSEQDAAFSAGLLHDLGRLLLLCYLPEEMNRVLALTTGENGQPPMSMHDAEHEVLGFDHGEAGELLAWQWKLPAMLSRTMRYHHTPAECPHESLLPWTIHLGNAIADAMEAGAENIGTGDIDPQTLAKLGLDLDDTAKLVADLSDNCADLHDLMSAAA